MIKLEWSEGLKRKIRQDDLADLTIPTWTLVEEAMKAGKIQEALEFLDYARFEAKAMHHAEVTMVDQALTLLASINEENVEKYWRKRYTPRVEEWLSTTPGTLESLQRICEYQRGHFGSGATVKEEEDRYVESVDLCGSGGELRKSGDCGVTRKAYPWAWNKVGVPYYCAHCCIFMEHIPIEKRGYPIRVHEIEEGELGVRCVRFYYKRPELIPEEYFERIGKVKTIK